MAWTSTPTQTATEIGRIFIELRDIDGDNATREILARVHVLDQAGEVMSTWSGDAKPHLPASILTALASALDDIRTEAENKLL
jgi:hypothetical protein